MQYQGGLRTAILRIALAAVAAGTVLGCAALSPAATSTPIPTATLTPLPTKTLTPQPTQTSTPTQVPTPAGVGAVVPYGLLEITVLKIATHDLIVPGGLYYYYPTNRTELFLDVGVRVRNTGTATVIYEEDLAVEQADGRFRPVEFASVHTMNMGAEYDPFTVGISASGIYSVPIDGLSDVFLRLVYVVPRGQTMLFGIADSPRIAIPIGR